MPERPLARPPRPHPALGLLALFLLAAAVPAQGELRITSVTQSADVVDPDVETATITILGEADCSSILLRRPPADRGGLPLLVQSTGDRMVLAAPFEIMLNPDGCEGNGFLIPIRMDIHAIVESSAPAMAPLEGRVQWTIAPGPLDQFDPLEASTTFRLRAAPVLVPEVSFATNFQYLNGTAQFRARVSNLGNAPFMVEGAGSMDAEAAQGQVPGGLVDVGSATVPAGNASEILVTVHRPPGHWLRAQVWGNLTFTSTMEPRPPPRTVPFTLLVANPSTQRAIDIPTYTWGLAAIPLVLIAAGLVAWGVAVQRRRAREAREAQQAGWVG